MHKFLQHATVLVLSVPHHITGIGNTQYQRQLLTAGVQRHSSFPAGYKSSELLWMQTKVLQEGQLRVSWKRGRCAHILLQLSQNMLVLGNKMCVFRLLPPFFSYASFSTKCSNWDIHPMGYKIHIFMHFTQMIAFAKYCEKYFSAELHQVGNMLPFL